MSQRLPKRSIYIGCGEVAERVWEKWRSFLSQSGFQSNLDCLEYILEIQGHRRAHCDASTQCEVTGTCVDIDTQSTPSPHPSPQRSPSSVSDLIIVDSPEGTEFQESGPPLGTTVTDATKLLLKSLLESREEACRSGASQETVSAPVKQALLSHLRRRGRDEDHSFMVDTSNDPVTEESHLEERPITSSLPVGKASKPLHNSTTPTSLKRKRTVSERDKKKTSPEETSDECVTELKSYFLHRGCEPSVQDPSLQNQERGSSQPMDEDEQQEVPLVFTYIQSKSP